jgi:hypothetical protein
MAPVQPKDKSVPEQPGRRRRKWLSPREMVLKTPEDFKKYVKYFESLEQKRKGKELEKKKLAKRIERLEADLRDLDAIMEEFFHLASASIGVPS